MKKELNKEENHLNIRSRKNQNYTWVICAAQNMKNIAIKNDNVDKEPLTLSSNIKYFIKIMKKFINNLLII